MSFSRTEAIEAMSEFAREQGMVNLVCETCEGDWKGYGGFDRNGSHAEDRYVEYDCPDCVGGIPKTLIEAAAKAMHRWNMRATGLTGTWDESAYQDVWQQGATAALLAIRDQKTP